MPGQLDVEGDNAERKVGESGMQVHKDRAGSRSKPTSVGSFRDYDKQDYGYNNSSRRSETNITISKEVGANEAA